MFPARRAGQLSADAQLPRGESTVWLAHHRGKLGLLAAGVGGGNGSAERRAAVGAAARQHTVCPVQNTRPRELFTAVTS